MNNDNISINIVLDELYSKQRLGIKPGLDRTLLLCKSVGNPQQNFKSIHVAGTNGKGSVCSSIASILMCAGFKTGLYTSPHLVEFNERIRINQNLISDDQLVEYYLKLKDISNEIGATFFEITTVMAFLYFSDQEVDIAVIETGMGGRFDSTNVLLPLLSIITKIDLDHQEYLGNTVKEIATEKAGIIKENVCCIVSKNNQEVNSLIENFASKGQIVFADDFIELGRKEIHKDFSSSWTAILPDNSHLDFEYGLSGAKQYDNIKVILSAIFVLKNTLNIADDCITNGLKNVKQNTGLKARVDIIRFKPLIILDGSHNDGSIENLFETIAEVYPQKVWNIVFNKMADKNVSNVIPYLKKYAKSVVIPTLKISRASNSIELASNLSIQNVQNVSHSQSTVSAIESLLLNDNILIFGSFYLIGEALEYFYSKNMLKIPFDLKT